MRKAGALSKQVQYAAKVINLKKFPRDVALEEARVCKKLSASKFVPRYYEHFEEERCFKLVIVMEFVKGVTLFKHIADHGIMTEESARNIVCL